MTIIKLRTLYEQCGGCPTHFTGETVDGGQLSAYLRHGYMEVTLDGETLVSTNPRELDGVCSFDDFKRAARRNGYIIVEEGAAYSSYIDEIEETVQNLYKDVVWVEFIQDFYAKTQDKHYKKGERYTAKITIADVLVEANLAVIDDDTYVQKKAAFEKEKSNQ